MERSMEWGMGNSWGSGERLGVLESRLAFVTFKVFVRVRFLAIMVVARDMDDLFIPFWEFG